MKPQGSIPKCSILSAAPTVRMWGHISHHKRTDTILWKQARVLQEDRHRVSYLHSPGRSASIFATVSTFLVWSPGILGSSCSPPLPLPQSLPTGPGQREAANSTAGCLPASARLHSASRTVVQRPHVPNMPSFRQWAWRELVSSESWHTDYSENARQSALDTSIYSHSKRSLSARHTCSS